MILPKRAFRLATAVGLLLVFTSLEGASSLRAPKKQKGTTSLPDENNTHDSSSRDSASSDETMLTCGCEASCTNDIQGKLVTDAAGTYDCGSRIKYVMRSQSKSEMDACRQVSHETFKDGGTCGPHCDPDICQTMIPMKRESGGRNCGCVDTCTGTVLNRVVTDSHGSFKCSGRIDWLMNNKGMTEEEACRKVANEFADKDTGCGGCNPDTCKPASNTQPYHCGCDECTDTIWDNDAKGHTCGKRIEWLIENKGMSELGACGQVAGVEFKEVCGDCHPSKCGQRSIGGSSGSLLWSEEFNGNILDEETWNYDEGNWGWGNRELQDYKKDSASIKNGALVIKAERDGNYFTSARINTIGKFSFLYGEVEAAIKFPNLANGLWPALWLLGSNFREIGWPRCGEIDIFEMGISNSVNDGMQNRRVGSHAHWDAFGNYAGAGRSIDVSKDLNDGQFHTFTMSWTKQWLKTSLDGNQIWQFDISNPDAFDGAEFHQPFSFIINLAIGGSYTGILDGTGITAPFPAELEVDYIRVYRNEDTRS